MKMLGAIAALLALLSASAFAQEPAACDVPDYLLTSDYLLSRVSLVVHDRKRLDIVVVGTGSSVLPGHNGAANAYPAKLQDALRRKLPGIEVNVTAETKSGRSAAEMVKALEGIVKASQPGLVIWQTGTYDAMHGLDPDDFRGELEEGLQKLKAAGVDSILVNMQYSPRTETMIALDPYAEGMRLVAREQEVPLFDRLAIMRYWNDIGAFDLYASGKDPAMAQQVHDCLGRALASSVINSGQLSAYETKASR
jgi:hypothetical protein